MQCNPISNHHNILYKDKKKKKKLKFTWNHERPGINKLILSKKSNVGEIAIPDQKIIYYRAIVIKTVWCWYKNRHVWNQTEDPNMSTYKYRHLVFDKASPHPPQKKREKEKKYNGEKASSTNGARKTGSSHVE